MPPLNLPKYMIFGRPIKPVTFGMTFLMAVNAITGIANIGVFQSSPLGDVLSVFGGVAFTAFVAGWCYKNQSLIELGLAIATGMWVARCFFLILYHGYSIDESAFLNFGVALVSGGSYLLERADSLGSDK